MAPKSWQSRCSLGCAGLFLLGGVASARDALASPADAAGNAPPDAAPNPADSTGGVPGTVPVSWVATAYAAEAGSDSWGVAAPGSWVAPAGASAPAPVAPVPAPPVTARAQGAAADPQDTQPTATDAAADDQGTEPSRKATKPRKAAASTPALTADMRRRIEAQGERLDAMRSQIATQVAQIDQMKHELAVQEAQYQNLRNEVGMAPAAGEEKLASREVLASQRGGREESNWADAPTASPPSSDTPAAAPGGQAAIEPVGQAPERSSAPPAVAPIFNQPGVLTPLGKFVVEPSYQFGYSSAVRVDLIGYTVIPAILIGLIDARQVKTTTQTAAVAMRYGVTNRLELEVKVPYQFNHTDTISREIFTGSAEDNVFTSSGHGIGDIEATARYQINDGGADKPYYIGWLRFKSRTGTDPFEVTTDCVTRCVQNATGTGLPLQVPTGSGFYSLQPGLTWLLPSDPAVFFGNISYLYNFARHNVSRHVLLGGTEPLGTIKVGNVIDVSVGMGFALNEKASISLGYDQSFIGTTKQNGHTVAGSAKSVLGSLLIGGSYRMSDKRTLNVALGIGVTRDTPDVNLTVRVPITL